MQLSKAEVTGCIALVHEVVEHYKLNVLNSARTMRSVEDLEWIVGEFLQKRVTIESLKVPAAGKWIKAACVVTAEGDYEIYVLTGLDLDARRFIICKELFHVVLDEEHRRNMDTFGHLQEVTTTFPVANSKPNSAAACEYFAEASAMEFLFPYAERVLVLEAANGAGPNYAEIASRYGIPQEYVESYLGAPLMDFFAQVMAG
ncbi:ImmA/IrrE family metallo-endopeptidase [Stenotrophomonas indicatrix]|uniref:ImmA/IrrE family metallo-endopeptidase n=1 Tax=Stenotrophomonas indicatrix TaxID=2045451 RepID=UPI001CBCADB8|nr:ImmA/IrrE family metallo-endopeptidase [Stenotrophomonas indicatrix]